MPSGYMCQINYLTTSPGPAREEVVYSAREFYQQAMDAANEALEPWDPIRLGLALNFSVFYYEVEGNKTLAIGLVSEKI